jgi:hypothetical protein
MAFKTRMVWRSIGAGHWDVELVQLIGGRAALLATLSLDERIDLGATQYVLELQKGGEQLLKPAGGAIG